MQRLIGVCVMSLLVTAGCGGGEEDPILVPATMAPTTAAPATLASTTTTTLAPTPTTAAPVASTTTTAAPVVSTTAIPTTTEAADVGPASVLVEVGDSLSKIAKRYDTTTEILAAINGICDVNQIYVGQKILLAGAEFETDDEVDPEPISVTVLVEVGDSLSKIAKQYDTTVDDLMVTNDITDPNLLLVGQELVVSGIVPIVPDVEPPVC
ncbi:MAG: LysM peptidoglycan-binding domain-containing protein [Acidimicrobiales bacterium]|nr:LysM peptidoglycan-binding domain-containing protein [Acidimicrobiales bacterium]